MELESQDEECRAKQIAESSKYLNYLKISNHQIKIFETPEELIIFFNSVGIFWNLLSQYEYCITSYDLSAIPGIYWHEPELQKG